MSARISGLFSRTDRHPGDLPPGWMMNVAGSAVTRQAWAVRMSGSSQEQVVPGHPRHERQQD